METDYVHVDAACIYFLDWPSRFDVIVTDNMFGDIITDLGAMIQGGMGIAAGGNINPEGVTHVRAHRRHGARPHRQGRRSTRWRRSARSRCCCASSARTAAADAWTAASARPRADEVDARRRDGVQHARGRRPRGGGSDGMTRRDAVARWSCTTPRCATARSAPTCSFTIEDRLRILHRLDAVGFPYVEGRLARREPARHRVLQARHEGDAPARAAHGVRHDAQGGRAARRTPPSCASCSTPAPRSSAWWASRGTCTSPRRCAPTWTRASPWCATPSRSCVAQGRRVFFDAEHFFDGYVANPAFAMAVLAAAEEAGAERLVLCDTNGGMLPFDVARIVTGGEAPGRGAAGDPRAQRRGLRGGELAHRGGRRRASGPGRRSTATASAPATRTSSRSPRTSC